DLLLLFLYIGRSGSISCETTWGCLRALETFSQLITPRLSTTTVFYIPYTPFTCKDSPRFAHRGLLIDSSRHFLPIDVVKLVIDALSYDKFNTLHWHLTDSQSWPVVSEFYPNVTNGAYSPTDIYTKSDLLSIVSYARYRGIRVVPEFDSPSHLESLAAGYPS